MGDILHIKEFKSDNTTDSDTNVDDDRNAGELSMVITVEKCPELAVWQ